ncbi:hypothetical protein B0I27_11638 [Arcticibacter pallidicorallinus]|uniref:Uncharacterized protein n=1 Tax=Arcticibacter pallidicorallinus TaxID=1259464 RepID=A0A2T0TQV1_9SPHI|nr:hypothetical protein [Arcticibacter pallidicorallinus]PRY48104.1 hypothetical protein B0I27_11638 [Arcticibacter pallidicorallinus]
MIAMKKSLLCTLIFCTAYTLKAQETLQSVTDRGATTSKEIMSDAGFFFRDRWAKDKGWALYAEGGMGYLWTTGFGRLMSFNYSTGYLGLGTSNPGELMHIRSASPQIQLEKAGLLNWFIGNRSGNDFSIGTDANGHYHALRIDANGTVSVSGKIRAQEIKVEGAGNWPDYVFEPSYRPTALSDIESYITTNKHLPDIPSAKEVEASGVNLGEMNVMLLKKIEELTLHLIQKEKELNKEKVINELQSERLDSMQQQIDKIAGK